MSISSNFLYVLLISFQTYSGRIMLRR